jgi:hypothetical protein
MAPASDLAGIQSTHGDQAQPEVTDFGQQSVQGGQVSEQAGDDRLLAVAADLKAVEPGGPPAVKDALDTDLVMRGPAGSGHPSSSQRPTRAAAPSAAAVSPGRGVPVMAFPLTPPEGDIYRIGKEAAQRAVRQTAAPRLSPEHGNSA